MQAQNTLYKKFDLFERYDPVDRHIHTNALIVSNSMQGQPENIDTCPDLLDKYCICHLSRQSMNQTEDHEINNIERYTENSNTSDFDVLKKVKQRSHKNDLPFMQHRLHRLLSKIKQGKLTPFKQCTK